jgi:hypothetical protein
MHMEYPYPHPDPKYQNQQRSSPAVPIPFPQDTRQHQRHLSGSSLHSLPPPKNGTILTVNDHVSLGRTHSWSSLTRVSELDRRVVAEAMQEQQHGAERVLAPPDHSTQSSSSMHLSPIQGCGILSEHPRRPKRKSNTNGPHVTTTQSQDDNEGEKVLRGAGIVKKSILRNQSALTQSLTTGPPKDTLEPTTSESNYSSSNHQEIRRMRKQALMDEDQISALTFHDLEEPRLNISMICPDGTVKSIDSCLLGNDDDDDIVALGGMATKYYGQPQHKTFLHHEMDALDRVISHFEGQDPEPSLATSSDSSGGKGDDDEDSGLFALEDQEPKRTTTTKGNRGGGVFGTTPCSSTRCSTEQLSSSYNSGDLGQGCMNPLTDALTSQCGIPAAHPDPNVMLQELKQAAKNASSKPAMRLVDDMNYVLSQD